MHGAFNEGKCKNRPLFFSRAISGMILSIQFVVCILMRLYDDSAVCRVRKHLLKNIGALQDQLSNTEFTCHDMNICRS